MNICVSLQNSLARMGNYHELEQLTFHCQYRSVCRPRIHRATSIPRTYRTNSDTTVDNAAAITKLTIIRSNLLSGIQCLQNWRKAAYVCNTSLCIIMVKHLRYDWYWQGKTAFYLKLEFTDLLCQLDSSSELCEGKSYLKLSHDWLVLMWLLYSNSPYLWQLHFTFTRCGL